MDLSFVVPAFNEEHHIGSTLRSIRDACEGRWCYEVWVVDNGSTDRTVERALELGGKVIQQIGGTVAGLRNEGAARARGRYLIFIDADVTLERSWRSTVDGLLSNLTPERLILAGSSCSVPQPSSWIERSWFARRNESASSHIGSAHMIVRRDAFSRLGGFDAALETGEDYELCARVTGAGGELIRLPSSVACHHGYPKSLLQFMRREVWHGRSDASSLQASLRSSVSRAALAFSGLHILTAIAAILGYGRVALAAGGLILMICLAAAHRTFRGQSPAVLIANTALYYVYFAARALSFVSVWTRVQPRARKRTRVATSS